MTLRTMKFYCIGGRNDSVQCIDDVGNDKNDDDPILIQYCINWTRMG